MTYAELKINAQIKLKQKPDEARMPVRATRYTVVAKYPHMCIVEDSKGRRRGVAVGELIMNKVITQEPCFEAMRKECAKDKTSSAWHKRETKCPAEYAP